MSQQTKHLVETHNLPRQLKPFVGRKAEMAEIATLLADPACRLLTLVGPGGIGKTRLAINEPWVKRIAVLEPMPPV